MYKTYLTYFMILFVTVGLAACESIETEAKYPTGADRAGTADANSIYDKPDSVLGSAGLFGLGGKDKENNVGGGSGIAVNSFLWRASLDTVSFMPLASADPFGGTILTDWYSPDANAKERFKINVFILTRELRSDGIRVRVFRQKLTSVSYTHLTLPTILLV